jgi:glutamate racemase
MKRLLISLLSLAGLVATTTSAGVATPASIQLEPILQKKQIKVVVTDSGLGGLSVVADLERKALAHKSLQSVDIVFCNALPEANCGYNDFKTAQRKAEVFSAALQGMVIRYAPDVVFIACNTLSVVYLETEISQTIKVPVIGIIDPGVDMIRERLASDPTASAVIFGTETTISANTHKTRLLAKGISGSRIITQSCGELASEIQTAPQGEGARNLIDLYVGEAAEQLAARNGKIVAALCCTHYGYCANGFAQAFAAAGRKEVEIVNPNEKMADLLFAPASADRFPAPGVTVAVVSRAFLSPDEIRSISALLERNAPKTAEALRKYERKPDLFPFRPE